MSTRGCIARPLGDIGFEGRYQHSDSYPTWLGRVLWRAYHETFQGDLEAMLDHAINQHVAGWSAYPERCYCHWQGREETDDNWIRFIAGDPANDGDPLFMEWVYVLTPAGMEVLVSGPRIPNDYDSGYVHRRVSFVPWTSPEPDWAVLERARYPEEAVVN